MASLSDGKPKDLEIRNHPAEIPRPQSSGYACELPFWVRGSWNEPASGGSSHRQREGSLAHDWRQPTVFMAFRPVVPVDVEVGPGAIHDHETGPGIARRPATSGSLHRFQPRPQHPDKLRRLFPPD